MEISGNKIREYCEDRQYGEEGNLPIGMEHTCAACSHLTTIHTPDFGWCMLLMDPPKEYTCKDFIPNTIPLSEKRKFWYKKYQDTFGEYENITHEILQVPKTENF